MGEKFRCEECGIDFETKEELERHMKEHHSHEHRHEHHHH
ncbi:MAG: hypothetical protein F7C07_07560 [Desulfurococcales archaeon]|nr:hypothetical protein [Desulfurococcales archaeon]